MVPDYTADLGWSASSGQDDLMSRSTWMCESDGGATGSRSKERCNKKAGPEGPAVRRLEMSRGSNRLVWAGSEGLCTFNE